MENNTVERHGRQARVFGGGQKMNQLDDSVLDIFKIGPGPSSSHTIGPMRMANDFTARSPDARHIEVDFYGSMALTGRGHGSDRAVIAGLLGERPETCDIARLNALSLDEHDRFESGGWDIKFCFHNESHSFPYANTVVLRDIDTGQEQIYYSVGGGFIEREGAAARRPCGGVPLPCRYRDLDTFRKMLAKNHLTAEAALRANEQALHPDVDLDAALDLRLNTMLNAVERGLHAEGVLPGVLRLRRRAVGVWNYARRQQTLGCGENTLFIDAYALAAAEENAAGALVVTAPTSGSAGLLPALVYFYARHRQAAPAVLRRGLLIAGLIGAIARRNASIAGAEVGCQGEIGVAAAMGAAWAATAAGSEFPVAATAAEIALEHHLGLSCDPVGGYVQIPCIERNAAGAVTAYNASLLAAAGAAESARVSFDEALAAMLETGRAMRSAYKETGLGGLANCACCI